MDMAHQQDAANNDGCSLPPFAAAAVTAAVAAPSLSGGSCTLTLNSSHSDALAAAGTGSAFMPTRATAGHASLLVPSSLWVNLLEQGRAPVRPAPPTPARSPLINSCAGTAATTPARAHSSAAVSAPLPGMAATPTSHTASFDRLASQLASGMQALGDLHLNSPSTTGTPNGTPDRFSSSFVACPDAMRAVAEQPAARVALATLSPECKRRRRAESFSSHLQAVAAGCADADATLDADVASSSLEVSAPETAFRVPQLSMAHLASPRGELVTCGTDSVRHSMMTTTTRSTTRDEAVPVPLAFTACGSATTTPFVDRSSSTMTLDELGDATPGNLLPGFDDVLYPIPTLPRHEWVDDSKPSISPEIMERLLRGEFKDRVAKIIIIDCRFPYEYQGGHIRDAINMTSPFDAIRHFFPHDALTAPADAGASHSMPAPAAFARTSRSMTETHARMMHPASIRRSTSCLAEDESQYAINAPVYLPPRASAFAPAATAAAAPWEACAAAAPPHVTLSPRQMRSASAHADVLALSPGRGLPLIAPVRKSSVSHAPPLGSARTRATTDLEADLDAADSGECAFAATRSASGPGMKRRHSSSVYTESGTPASCATPSSTCAQSQRLPPMPAQLDTVIIFHCEFSVERGPGMFEVVRGYDRARHVWPHLAYPYCFVMRGGYKQYHEYMLKRGTAVSYTSMTDPRYDEECRLATLLKAQTYNAYHADGGRSKRRTSTSSRPSSVNRRTQSPVLAYIPPMCSFREEDGQLFTAATSSHDDAVAALMPPVSFPGHCALPVPQDVASFPAGAAPLLFPHMDDNATLLDLAFHPTLPPGASYLDGAFAAASTAATATLPSAAATPAPASLSNRPASP